MRKTASHSENRLCLIQAIIWTNSDQYDIAIAVYSQHMNLTHWGLVTHICVSNLIIIGSDNGLTPGRRQAIIWTNAGILLTGLLGTNFSEILSKICIFSFTKIHLKNVVWKMAAILSRPQCVNRHSVEVLVVGGCAGQGRDSLWPSNTICHHSSWPMLIHVTIWRLFAFFKLS